MERLIIDQREILDDRIADACDLAHRIERVELDFDPVVIEQYAGLLRPERVAGDWPPVAPVA